MKASVVSGVPVRACFSVYYATQVVAQYATTCILADDVFFFAFITQTQFLGTKGGCTLDDCVKRMMPEVVTTAFGKECNIFGAARHGKVGIGKTQLFRVIFSKLSGVLPRYSAL